eukprot:2740009-Alexandrium_andersonii.AAC.1
MRQHNFQIHAVSGMEFGGFRSNVQTIRWEWPQALLRATAPSGWGFTRIHVFSGTCIKATTVQLSAYCGFS